MKQLKLRAGQAALVIVAHPDDETIWFGGTILKNNQVRWTVLVLCRASDPDRAPKFKKVAEHLKAEGIIADLEDEGLLNIRQSINPIKKIIKEQLAGRSFDYCFTHGVNGEYGHERHKAVHQAVSQMVRARQLKTAELWNFNYKKISKFKLAPKADSDSILRLSKKEYADKIAIMSQIYGFDAKGIDANYCTNPEAFKKITN